MKVMSLTSVSVLVLDEGNVIGKQCLINLSFVVLDEEKAQF